jgi:hypothetical protein
MEFVFLVSLFIYVIFELMKNYSVTTAVHIPTNLTPTELRCLHRFRRLYYENALSVVLPSVSFSI